MSEREKMNELNDEQLEDVSGGLQKTTRPSNAPKLGPLMASAEAASPDGANDTPITMETKSRVIPQPPPPPLPRIPSVKSPYEHI